MTNTAKNRLLFGLIPIFCIGLSANAEVDPANTDSSGESTDLVTEYVETPPPPPPSNIEQATAVMEEMVVSGRPLEFPNMQTFQDRHIVHQRGEHYYRTRQYKAAFPYLLASAKQGFKFAQARLGFIYQQGLGDVPRNGWAAIGWLGVAATPRTDPEIRNYYRSVLAKIPDELMPTVEQVVGVYIEHYGSDATGMQCQHVRSAGTHISALKCNFEDEFNFADASATLSGIGISPVGGDGSTTLGTGTGSSGEPSSAPPAGGPPGN